jgi:hypothetical protein
MSTKLKLGESEVAYKGAQYSYVKIKFSTDKSEGVWEYVVPTDGNVRVSVILSTSGKEKSVLIEKKYEHSISKTNMAFPALVVDKDAADDKDQIK